jgi:hypothetical protein
MKPVWWMAALSGASAMAASLVAGSGTEIFLGMIAPLLVASAFWIAAVRTYTRRPEQLTSMMMAAFAAKLVVFGAYVGLAIGVFHVRPVPFAVSFAGYFIALHLTEAFCLQRLFAERMRAA